MHTSQFEWDAQLLRATLEEIRTRAGLTQADIGALAGRDRSTANRWLHGRHQPDHESAARFAAAVRATHPELDELTDRFMKAAGYQGHTTAGGLTPAPERFIDALRIRARNSNQTLGELLVREGLAEPAELVIPDALPPDPIIEEISASGISDETKEKLIRLHLDNRSRRFEEERLRRKKAND